MRERALAGGLLLLLAVAIAVAAADPALADGDQVGKNIGDMLGGWGKWIYFGMLALFGAPHLKPPIKLGEILVFAGAAIVIGIFVLDTAVVTDIIHGIGRQVGKGANGVVMPLGLR